MTDPVAAPDLASAIAAFDQTTRDDIAAALRQDSLGFAAIPPEVAARLADPGTARRHTATGCAG